MAIEFTVGRDGAVLGMRIVATAGEVVLDRAAWGGITGSNPFRPLPAEYNGERLLLRFTFFYNPGGGGPGKAGISVSISPSGDAQVAAGETKAFTATVTGAENRGVDWSIAGAGCSGVACGKVTGGSYHAPSVLPNPPVVSRMASSQVDDNAYTSVTIHIVKKQGD